VGARPRLVELLASVSLATDLGTGQPMEHALRTCLLATRAAEVLGVPDAEQWTIASTALLRFLGCTASASETASMAGGDDIAFNAAMAPVVMADDREALPHLLRHLGAGLPLARRAGRIAAAMTDPGSKARTLSAHCEVGARLAARMGLPDAVVDAVGHGYERWDGRGLPDGLAGEEIPLAVRLAVVARDVDLCRPMDWDATSAVLTRRRGDAYDPGVVDLFLAGGRAWLEELEEIDPWTAVLAGTPGGEVDDDRLDDVLGAFGDFADLKSPWFAGHSRAVADLAGAAAAGAGLGPGEANRARRAGLVHDIGIVGVAAGIWNRPGALTAEGWERVRLHPYLTERILARCPALAPLAVDAGAHHERLDGSGYVRGPVDPSPVGQLVATADVYCALREARPHRPAFDATGAADLLTAEADAGRLGRAAVHAVLAAAGVAPAPVRIVRPAGLTEREVDVLRLIARGRSNKEVAAELRISPKTVGTHVEHIYTKAGVTSRAAATVFAMEEGPLRR
jgi:HD-GYP domain-containing protein (c-di-GMP phosphodiesterase class II)